ncbi:LmbE family N-acetylglucosaminyl deacetylase [Sphingobacterium zeae]|uniref:LmbE family N-acetylglucosaminyl deacetylase n=1 Tax=Sphingobacterium zeae TaxID=1776859 RepID=A0ABU0U0A5_9SPHI|nr:PIG-L family deacetylase [Sphingobacterium zeae]MDQ1148379.1 LmbE family N-acetylglucosaminyl deacetylase [Sphingobacterium zeae]
MRRPFISVIIILAGILSTSSVKAQNPQWDAAEIKLNLEKLNTLGSVLYFAAHPDDENTRLIAWLAQEKKYKTAYLSLTRGDGGQNLIGTEQGIELGLIRTQELLAARKIDKGEQFFSSAYDFGFSKTPEETFEFWDKKRVLGEAVWIIRKFRPDVIITRFPPDSRGGHGHHQASAILAQEAFKAAADPNQFSEQLQFVSPWQAKRLLWNTANFGGQNNTREDQLKIDIGDYNSLLGASYGEIAAHSRSSHKSQGFGSASQRGSSIEYFEFVDGVPAEKTLLDNVDTSWKRVKNGNKVQPLIDHINQIYQIDKPELIINELIKLYKILDEIDDEYWKTEKKKEVEKLILACGGIWFESVARNSSYALGDEIKVDHSIIVRRPNITVELTQLNGNSIHDTLKTNRLQKDTMLVIADRTTQPYWLMEPHGKGKFNISDFNLTGYPENPDAPSVSIEIRINGQPIIINQLIKYKYTDPVRGEIYNPIVILPPLTAKSSSSLALTQNARTVKVNLTFQKNGQIGATTFHVKPNIPKGWEVLPASFDLSFKESERIISREISIKPSDATQSSIDTLGFLLNNKERLKEIKSIEYNHIPDIVYFPDAAIKMSNINLINDVKNVAYIHGAGDLIPESLVAIGIKVDVLSNEQALKADLSTYDAVIFGVRIFNVNKQIAQLQNKVLAYVKMGGTVLEQYNVNNGMIAKNFGPFPFSIGRSRVTDEKATVHFDKNDPIFNYPNKISEADFKHWVQERGLYFAEDIDKRYRTPITMQDPGEALHNGSLLVAHYGKGKFVYTSLSFFRQLPAGIPGAYRLFVNLLSKSK